MSTTLRDFEYPSEAVFECPYPFFRALHEEAPVYQVPGRNDFIVSRYDDVLWVTRHPEIFSNRRDGWSHHAAPRVAEVLSQGCPFEPDMAYSDPPQNADYRSVASKVLSAARLKAAAPTIQRIVNELIDGFVDRGECELMEEFAIPLPSAVISHLLGLSMASIDDYRHWTNEYSELASGLLSEDRAVEAARSVVALHKALMAEFEERIVRPREDGLSEMATSPKSNGERFTVPELVSMTITVILGGHSTTAHTTGNAMRLLLQHPDQLARVLENYDLIPRAIEEALRMESPAQWLQRIVKADTEVGGVPVPQGARVLVYYSAANRDESQFPDAEVFDIDRDNTNTHVAFGYGVHRCLGAPLARLELRIAFEALFDRLKNLRFKPGANDFRHLPHPLFRSPRHLWLAFDNA